MYIFAKHKKILALVLALTLSAGQLNAINWQSIQLTAKNAISTLATNIKTSFTKQNLSVKQRLGRTAIHLTIFVVALIAAKQLLQTKDIAKKNKDYGDINKISKFNRIKNAVRIFIHENFSTASTRILEACKYNKPDILKCYIENGYNVEFYSETNFQTPLSIACEQNNLEIVKLLVNCYSLDYINMQDCTKETPLIYACKNKNTEMVRLLLQKGAHESLNGRVREAAAELAPLVGNGLNRLTTELQRFAGAVNFHTTHLGEIISLSYYTPEIIDLLLSYCTIETINRPDHGLFLGATPINYACEKNDIYLIKALLKHGAIITEYTILDALKQNHPNPELVKVLLEHCGAIITEEIVIEAEKNPAINNYLQLFLNYHEHPNKERKSETERLEFIFSKQNNIDEFNFLIKVAFGKSINDLKANISKSSFEMLYAKKESLNLEKMFGVSATNDLYDFIKKAAEKNDFHLDKKLICKSEVRNNLLNKLKNKNNTDCRIHTINT